jgi:hypothetical protein
MGQGENGLSKNAYLTWSVKPMLVEAGVIRSEGRLDMKSMSLGMAATAALLGVSLSFGVASPAHAIGCGVTDTLSDLIAGASISCGNLTFSNVGQYFASATGGASAVTADSIFVSATSSLGVRAGSVTLNYQSSSLSITF